MGYFSLLEDTEPTGRTRALMVAACMRYCADVPGDGEQNLASEVDYVAGTVSVTDGKTKRTYLIEELI